MTEKNAFGGVTVLVLAVNETESLRQTVLTLEQVLSPDDTAKILIYYPPWITADCEAVINELAAECFPIAVRPEQQISSDRAECIMRVIRNEKDATHLLVWASDGEVASEKAALLVGAAKEDPWALVKFSRMMKGGSQPAGKNPFLKARDRAFCLLARARLRADITDALFMAYVLFPLAPFDSFDLTEAGMGILIEILAFFSRLGIRFIEFPVRAAPRAEAKSNVRLKQKFQAFFFLLRLGKANRRGR
ncbi:MAG: hypothetical protein FWH34_00360 [Desulfovibrionaceae bacterium]|nr:hypothetical protein [Desulfovibrionaceae bacterium]